MRREAVPCVLALIVAGSVIVSNSLAFRSCWYVPLRSGGSYVTHEDTTAGAFQTAIQQGKIELYGFPFVYVWFGFDNTPLNVVAIVLNGLIGVVLTATTWLVSRRLLDRMPQAALEVRA